MVELFYGMFRTNAFRCEECLCKFLLQETEYEKRCGHLNAGTNLFGCWCPMEGKQSHIHLLTPKVLKFYSVFLSKWLGFH